jgi:hypothetical protein
VIGVAPDGEIMNASRFQAIQLFGTGGLPGGGDQKEAAWTFGVSNMHAKMPDGTASPEILASTWKEATITSTKGRMGQGTLGSLGSDRSRMKEAQTVGTYRC